MPATAAAARQGYALGRGGRRTAHRSGRRRRRPRRKGGRRRTGRGGRHRPRRRGHGVAGVGRRQRVGGASAVGGGRVFAVEPFDDQSADFLERGEYATAIARASFVGGHAHRVHLRVHIRHRHGAGQIALVVLQHQRDVFQRQAHFGEVVAQVLQRFKIFRHLVGVGIGDEDDAVDALQHELAGGIVIDLARHRVEHELGVHAGHLAEVHGHEVEVERAIGLGGDRHHLAHRLLGGFLVDHLEIGRLARHAGTVEDDLAADFTLTEVDLYHWWDPEWLTGSGA